MITEADEAEIEASRAPLLEHLIELRSRLIKSLIAFVVMFFACFFFSRDIYNILVYPYVSVVGAQNAELIATHFLEQVFTNIKLSVFGAAFLSIELYEFANLIHEGATPQRSAFLSSFFTLVGTNGLHVTFGLIWLFTLVVQVSRKGLIQANKRRLMCLSLFWHFLDVVWIGVFTFVYLMGMLR